MYLNKIHTNRRVCSCVMRMAVYTSCRTISPFRKFNKQMYTANTTATTTMTVLTPHSRALTRTRVIHRNVRTSAGLVSAGMCELCALWRARKAIDITYAYTNTIVLKCFQCFARVCCLCCARIHTHTHTHNPDG